MKCGMRLNPTGDPPFLNCVLDYDHQRNSFHERTCKFENPNTTKRKLAILTDIMLKVYPNFKAFNFLQNEFKKWSDKNQMAVMILMTDKKKKEELDKNDFIDSDELRKFALNKIKLIEGLK